MNIEMLVAEIAASISICAKYVAETMKRKNTYPLFPYRFQK